ncbi:MAG: tetratricopeptide repeat protein [Armatimonadota bacterium]
MTSPGERVDEARRTRIRNLLLWVGVAVGLAGSVAAGGVDLASWIRGEAAGPPSRIERIDAMRTAFAEERWNDALSQARSLADILPDDPEAMRIEATSLVRTGRSADAVPVLLRIVDKDATDTTSRLALGQAMIDAGRAQEARTVLTALHRNPLANREVRMAAMGLLVRLEGIEPPAPPEETSRRAPAPGSR